MRWQEYTEELHKKDLHDPDNHDGVITHLESNILECEVKWALESITTNKASGGDEDLFCTVLPCIPATSSYHLLLLLGPNNFCLLLSPSLHEMFPRCIQFM